jgi:multidrug efflux system outer membrane protein
VGLSIASPPRGETKGTHISDISSTSASLQTSAVSSTSQIPPIFAWDSRKGSQDVARVERDAYVAQYEKHIQTAFKEVSDSLNTRTRLREQEQARQENVDALEQSYRLSDAPYHVGMGSYKAVLDARRRSTAPAVAQATRRNRLGNLVSLYEALGRGRAGWR